MKEVTGIYKDSVDKKLIIRQRIFFVIVSVLLVIDVINVAHKKVGSTLAISGFLLAIIFGVILSRMFKIFWHEEKQKVVSQLDRLGGVFLGLYILLEVGRTWIFKYWLSGATLSAFGLIILSGLLLGRFLGTGRKIKNVLIENGKIDSDV